MATLEQLEKAFIAADDAGNTEDAAAFAAEIKRLRAKPTEAQAKPRWDAIEAPTWVEQQLAKLPSIPQPIVNVAAGMVPGLLEGAPRVQNVATEDGYRTLGRFLKPAETLLGFKAAQAVTALPRLAQAGTLAKNVAAGGAGGAVAGTLSENPIEGALLGTATGGVIGGVLTPLLGGINKVTEIAQLWASGAKGQVRNYLSQLMPDDATYQQAIKELDNLAPLVAGEKPTAGMAAVSGQTPLPVLKSIEESARRNPLAAGVFAQRDAASEAARAAPLEEIAVRGRRFFNPETGRVELSEAEALRKQVTDPLYAMANRDLVQISPELQSVLNAGQVAMPSNRARLGVSQAQANMAAGGRPTAAGGGEAGYAPPSLLGGFTPEWAGGTTAIRRGEPFMPRNPAQTVATLQRVKDELTKKINDISQAADTPTVTLRNQLTDARRLLTDAMKTQSGSYAVANQIFKNYSAPQNQADVAEQLLKALQSPAGAERGTAFLTALQEAPRTLKRAGQPMFSDIREVMTPEQMRTVVSPLGESLRREAAYGRLRAPNLPGQEAVPETIEKNIPSIISRVVAFTKKGLTLASGDLSQEAKNMLDMAAADPRALAAIMKEAKPSERNAVINWLREREVAGTGRDIAGLLGGAYSEQAAAERRRGLLD